MPAPLVPPPANDYGAFTCPRFLQRWLDVNPVTKLDRVGSYITLPTFSVANTWFGYSTIVAAYNCEGPNNFSLKYIQGTLTNPNYLLCIMWVDSTGLTHRYALWTGVGEVLPFQPVLYTGQLIKKNFRFEVWSTNNTPLVQATPLNFYTSVLGGVDYRWGCDFVLVNNDGEQTNFNAIPTALPNINLVLPNSVWGAYGATLALHCVLEVDGFIVGAIYGIAAGNALSIKPVVGGVNEGIPVELVAEVTSYYILTTDSTLAGLPVTTAIYPAYLLPLTFPAGAVPKQNT